YGGSSRSTRGGRRSRRRRSRARGSGGPSALDSGLTGMDRQHRGDCGVKDGLFSHRVLAWLLLGSWAAMASRIRHLEIVPPAPADDPARLAARLARLEAETAALREEAEARGVFSRGWLAAGWARASLVLASLGLVMVVSVPYLMDRLGPADADPSPQTAHASPSPARPVPALMTPAPASVGPARLGPAPTAKIRTAVARSRARALQTPAAPAVEAPAPEHNSP